MVITEIFKSIHGEGTRSGRPCIFVRLTERNLRCTWRDTAYAFHGGKKYSVEDVVARVDELAGRDSHRVSLVEITCGEPLLQPDAPALAERLLASGYTVMIETSGELLVSGLPRDVIKIVDVKCPDSGEANTFNPANLEALGEKDKIKFVILSRRDFEFAREFTAKHQLTNRAGEVIFSPMFADPARTWPGLDPREPAEWILAEGLPVRLGVQLHKFILDPAIEGV